MTKSRIKETQVIHLFFSFLPFSTTGSIIITEYDKFSFHIFNRIPQYYENRWVYWFIKIWFWQCKYRIMVFTTKTTLHYKGSGIYVQFGKDLMNFKHQNQSHTNIIDFILKSVSRPRTKNHKILVWKPIKERQTIKLNFQVITKPTKKNNCHNFYFGIFCIQRHTWRINKNK